MSANNECEPTFEKLTLQKKREEKTLRDFRAFFLKKKCQLYIYG